MEWKKLGSAILMAVALAFLFCLRGQAQEPEIKHHDPFWRGEYYNNRSLSGFPVLVRGDPDINFDWGTGSPAPGIPQDRFSVRWTRTLDLPASDYIFTVTVDDGVRLWVDGRLVIDQWRDQPIATYSSRVSLSAGHHVIQMEYYENIDRAVVRLTWSAAPAPPPPPPPLPPPPPPPLPPPPPTPVPPIYGWRGEYFNNRFLDGSPALVRDDPAIDFNWGLGSPAPGIGSDDFSVRWTKSVYFSAGNYRFWAETDDGVRLKVDIHTVIDQWYDHAAMLFTGEIYLLEGYHTVILEYYEHGDKAVCRIGWELAPPYPGPTFFPPYPWPPPSVVPPPWPPYPIPTAAPPPVPPYGAWYGEYFNNPYLFGAPLFTRFDSEINFTWGWAGPGDWIPPDNFSVRWKGDIYFPYSGCYSFFTRSDDGVRLWVDGRLLINHWYDQTHAVHTGSVYLNAGTHQVQVEYYDHLYWSEITVWWDYGGYCHGGY
ncbi:MAG: PA14 domain-containing protein [Anaerolineae bacterium]